jgi:hypothetical protein
MITTLDQYSARALANYRERARATGLDQLAGFTFNDSTRFYEVEVCGHVVAELRTLKEVEAFSEMHHGGFLSSHDRR